MGPGAGLELQNLIDLKHSAAAHNNSTTSIGGGAADKVCRFRLTDEFIIIVDTDPFTSVFCILSIYSVAC